MPDLSDISDSTLVNTFERSLADPALAYQVDALRAELERRLPDRQGFIRDNAPALVNSLQAQVHRQQAELARLNQGREHLTAERDQLREALLGVWALADDELVRKGAVPGSFIPQIEADARAALAASGITVGD